MVIQYMAFGIPGSELLPSLQNLEFQRPYPVFSRPIVNNLAFGIQEISMAILRIEFHGGDRQSDIFMQR